MIFNWIMMLEVIKFYAFNSFVELSFQISFNPECVNLLQNINMFNVVYKFVLYMCQLEIFMLSNLLSINWVEVI